MTVKATIIIPARMASTRLPGKPLANIHGKPMIAHVIDRARESELGDICVACCEQEVYDAVHAYGAQAVMTEPDLPSGTDRIFQAMEKSGIAGDYIVNVQGDLPTIAPDVIQKALDIAVKSGADISTLVAEIRDESEVHNPNVVKAVFASNAQNNGGRALYFTRATAPYGEGALYHHIGLYVYKKEALKRFVLLPPSPLEKREKLEQLRALEAGMHIEVGVVDTVPFGVDTQGDLEKAKKMLSPS